MSMKSNNKKLAILILFVLIAGCGGGGSTTFNGNGGNGHNGSGGGSGVVSSPSITGINVLPITVNGSLCSASTSVDYPNKPCVSITVCTPGTSGTGNCQNISDILLDTGSWGLRIYKSALSAPLAASLIPVTVSSIPVAECAEFGGGTSLWGPVQLADVTLGTEIAPSVPIQVIDSTFGTVPGACGTPDASPSAAGFTGILGVGVFAQDCGSPCTSHANNGMYYSCSGLICTGTTIPLLSQVQNPVVSLPTDSNGLMVQLPSIPSGGATAANGYLVLGIGSQSNNIPTGVKTYPTNSISEFITTLTGTTTSYPSFIDSGSNGLFFQPLSASQLPTCSGWFCPSTTQNLSATNTGSTGSPSGLVSFQIANANLLFYTGNNAFNDLGAYLPGNFDWGLPFFYGRTEYVWIGIEGQTSTLGAGPYWAY
jgi:hypothetical protein